MPSRNGADYIVVGRPIRDAADPRAAAASDPGDDRVDLQHISFPADARGAVVREQHAFEQRLVAAPHEDVEVPRPRCPRPPPRRPRCRPSGTRRAEALGHGEEARAVGDAGVAPRGARQATRNSRLTPRVADSMHALTGMAGLLALAWAASENRRAIPWRAVVAGDGAARGAHGGVSEGSAGQRRVHEAERRAARAGARTLAGKSLVFGYLGGGDAPFQVSDPASNFVLAFRALPIVLVMSALSALLFYWRILPAVVRAMSFVLERTMRVGGVVGLSTAANVFVGMVEAPLLVRPHLARLSRASSSRSWWAAWPRSPARCSSSTAASSAASSPTRWRIS